MSLNDSTLEGDYYNTHRKDNTVEKKKETKPDDFTVIANTIADALFKTKPLHRRIYEGITNTRKRATRIIARIRR